jgi:mannose-1-phosphate guanylyltransferase
LIAVIAAGGQGTRFWPYSRQDLPKQFLRIAGERTMLQETVSRLAQHLRPSGIFIVCPAEYAPVVREQIPELSDDQLILEPSPRNTAACIGLAALALRRSGGDDVMGVFPADHLIADMAAFQAALETAEALARQDWLVTFGIRPRFAATGYGYIQLGDPLENAGALQAFQVRRFAEKPDAAMAQRFLDGGDYLWNSGIFVWRTERILEEIEASMPALSRSLDEIERNWENSDRVREIFSRLESVSIDYGVMEKASRVATVPCDPGWNDVGTWAALKEVLTADENGNASNTLVATIESRNNLAFSNKGKLVALLGVDDLIVVDSEDALLICRAGRSQEVKRIVDLLRSKDLDRFL